MARRPNSTKLTSGTPRAPRQRWEGRLEIIIAVALGLAAIVTAGAVYLNEHQEHKAELAFHAATHSIVRAAAVGFTSPAGRALELEPAAEPEAENHQDKAANYTLAEVILATSLFLFGVAGLSSRWRIKIGALSSRRGCSWSPWWCWRPSSSSGGR